MAAVMACSGWQVFELYGSTVAVHNPREYQHIDLRSLGAQQGASAGIRRGARGQDVVDQGLRSGATLKAPWTLLARCGRDSPICCSVARMRRSASEASFTPLCREITCASAPDWL